MSSNIASVRIFGKNYEFVDPVKLDGVICPLRAVLDRIEEYAYDPEDGKPKEGESITEFINAHKDDIKKSWYPNRRIWIRHIIDLLRIHKQYTDATDKEAYLDELSASIHYMDEPRFIAMRLLIAEPNIDMHSFIREVNLKCNEKHDDFVVQRNNPRKSKPCVIGIKDVVILDNNDEYYIDSTWEDISNEFLDGLITSSPGLSKLHGRQYKHVQALEDEYLDEENEYDEFYAYDLQSIQQVQH